MKKLILTFSLALFSTLGYGQDFKPVKIDSMVTAALPAGYTKTDTLGQQTFIGRSSYGFVVVTRLANAKNNTPLKKEKDLNNLFKNYAKGVMTAGSGTILNQRDTTVGNLKGNLFSLKTDDGSGNIQYRRFLLLYTQPVTYVFQYEYDDMRSDLVKDEVKTYFSSIKLSPELQRNDQYLDTQSSSTGLFGLPKIVLYGSGIVIMLVIVFFTTLNKRRNAQIA